MNEIEVDRLQPKPVVKVTGEFWAQTTEGDGNFNMFRFLQAGWRMATGKIDRLVASHEVEEELEALKEARD